MTFIIAIAFVLSLTVTAISVFKWERNSSGDIVPRVRAAGLLSIVLPILVIVLGSGVTQVPAGYRGVVLHFGAVTSKTFNEGLSFKTPIVESVELMSVQTEAFSTPVSAASRDLQDVQTEVTLNYALDPVNVNSVYQRLRRDYQNRIIVPAIQESVKAITAEFDAEELITQRPTVKVRIEDSLRDRLRDNGILMDTLSITNFSFSESFTEAIESKQVAAQKALEAKNRLVEIEVEAQQVKAAAEGQKNASIAKAEGDKQSKILNAQGEAEATRINAEAISAANREINASLAESDAVIRYNMVQKLSPGIKTIVLPSGENFILGPEVLGGQ